MSGGDVAVANSTDILNRRTSQSTPSRRSIISKITGGEEHVNPVSNTDAVLRNRSASTAESINSGSTGTRRKSVGSKRNGSINGSAAPALNLPNGDGGEANGDDGRPRADSDNRSNASKNSARGVISSFIQRSRSRQSSLEPESANDSSARARRSSTPNRKLSLRKPSFKKNSSPAPDVATQGDDVDGEEAAPPVPAVPTRVASNGNGVSKETAIPRHPSQKRRNSAKKEQGNGDADGQQQGYLGGAIAAVAGAGAAAGGAAAAVASRVTGGGQPQANGHAAHHGGDGDSEDEFHDAEPELDDIDEADEHGEPQQQQRQQQQKGAAKKSTQKRGRHRGLSEGEGVALGAGAGTGAGAAASRSGANRTASPESNAPESTRNGTADNAGKRRAGSTPAGGETSSTPTDQKAKKETPLYVREKAARVKKLTYDDVKMDEDEMLEDIKVARKALHLFLNSRMLEAEEIISKYADRKLYYALGDALISVIKGFMTFEPVDLAKSISYCKDSLHIASMLRKPSNTVASFGRFVRGTGHGPSAMAGMNTVQRHAELIYAESLLLKAVMGILYSGDFFAFVSEALNMRNAYGIYRSLQKYVEWADKKASGRDRSIDEDFRSGVHLGNGLISLILGLLPGKVLKIMEVIGYTGDTQVGLETLARPGGWSKNKKEPSTKMEEEGIRRQVSDMGILLYHLVISTFLPVTGVDIDYADKILHYNLKRYPEGVFFLYFSGRLYSTQTLAEKAVVQFRTARDIQDDYRNIKHITVWDSSLCHLALNQWNKAADCFKVLYDESNWSKAVYLGSLASCLYMNEKTRKEGEKLFREVPGKMQRIAGKSIPLEKFAARKAQKFMNQGRLLLPALEMSYVFHCFGNAPLKSLFDDQLVLISEALRDINEVEDPSQYHSGADEYWDDYCLAHFLRGVTLRFIAYPEKHAKVDLKSSPIPQDEAAEQADISFNNVLDASSRISYDNYLCLFSHYELGRLRANQGRTEEAREQFNIVMTGKVESKPSKGKISLQNMATLRSNAALSML